MKSAQPFLQVIGLVLIVFWLGACQPITDTPSASVPAPQRTASPLPATPKPTPRRTLVPTFPPAPTPTRAIQLDPSRLRGQTLTFWHPFSDGQSLLLETLAAEFTAKNTWGIQVQTVAYPGFGAMEEAFRLAQSSGELPDLLIGYPDQALRWDRSGSSLVDLTPYLQDQEWQLPQAVLVSYPPAIWSENELPPNGQTRRIGLPWYRSGLLLAYNQTLAQSLGFRSPPETLGTFRAQACAAAKAIEADSVPENDGRGGWLVSNDPGILINWLYAHDSSFLDAQDGDYTFDTPQSRQAISAFYQGFSEKCFWVEDTVSPLELFATRQALFIAITPSALAGFAADLEQVGFEDDWSIMALPALSGDPVLDLYGPAFLIPKTTPLRQLAAWAFVRWLSDPQQQATWADATGYFPASTASQALLKANSPSQPDQWRSALALVAFVHPEPQKSSWSSVRWAIGEAFDQVLKPDLSAANLLTILDLLDQLAIELDNQFP
jgi:ABC-type glycerol-3-phosphate transport system substrate-binding protein